MSENYENNTQVNDTPAEETVEQIVTEETAALQEQAASEEILLETDDIAQQEAADPEIDMTTGQKIKVLLMKPLASSIIKWVCIGLGIVGLVLYLIATSSRSMGETFAKVFGGISGGISSFFSLFPVSMLEIIICATALGILAYLIFIIVRTIQIKGKFHIGALWVQFGYTLLAVAGVFALLISMCYGVFTYREPLSKASGNQYSNGKVTNMEFSETMLYLIDKINNTLYEGNGDFYFTTSGFSRYSTNGRSTVEITKKVAEAFENASQNISTLKGSEVSSKHLLFSPLYSKLGIASIYSPFTGEVCVNTDYPEIVLTMQIAKAMAMQRGYTDDADASFIAFLVLTEYSDDYYLQYSGYFNAYLELSSKFYRVNGKNLHLYMANSLKESAKKEYVQLVKRLDKLYGVSSEIEYVPAATKLAANKYNDVAKLMLESFRKSVDNGTIVVDDTETYNFGRFCNYLVNFYKIDSDFQSEVIDVYDKYHPQP